MSMKVERKTLKFSIIINLFISIVKILGGIIWNTFTLTIDGIYTISDLLTDILAFWGIKLGRKRANKNHPLGYGRIFYIIELFMGFIGLVVGILVIYLSFLIDYQRPPFFIIFLIWGTVGLKIISTRKLFIVGKRQKSDLLIASSLESKMEAISSLGLIAIVILCQFIPKIDMIGGIFIAFLLILQAIRLIKQNIILLIGITYEDQIISNTVKKVVDKYKVINIIDISIMKSGPYYQITLTFKTQKNMKVHSLLRVQNKIKKELKAKTLGLKFIEFHLV